MERKGSFWYKTAAVITVFSMAFYGCAPEGKQTLPPQDQTSFSEPEPPETKAPTPIVRVTNSATETPRPGTPAPAGTETPTPTEAAVCVVDPESVLFTEGITENTKSVPVMSQQGFEELYGTGDSADLLRQDMLGQMGFELSRLAVANQEGVQTVVAPSFVTTAELTGVALGLTGGSELPFELVSYEPGTDYDQTGVHLLTVQAGNGWEVAFWEGGNIVQRGSEDESFTVDGLLEQFRQDEEGNEFLVAIPAQGIGTDSAAIGLVKNCAPTIVRIGGGPGGTTVNAVFDAEAFAAGSNDPWTVNPETAALPSLSDLPQEFLDLGISAERITFEDNYVLVDGEVWYEKLDNGRLLEKLFVYSSTSPESLSFEEGSVWGLTRNRVLSSAEYTRAELSGKISRIYRYRDGSKVWYAFDITFPLVDQMVTLQMNLGLGSTGGGDYFDIFCGDATTELGDKCNALDIVTGASIGQAVTAYIPYNFVGSFPDYFADASNKVSGFGANEKYFYANDHSADTQALVDALQNGNLDSLTGDLPPLYPDYIYGGF